MKRLAALAAFATLALACSRPSSPEPASPPAPPAPAAGEAAAPPAPAPPPGVPVEGAGAEAARGAVLRWLDACVRLDDAAAARLVAVEGVASPSGPLLQAAACDPLRGEAAMLRVGDAIAARFGAESFGFTTEGWKKDYLGPIERAAVTRDGERTLVTASWNAFVLRGPPDALKVVVEPSEESRADPAATLARAEQVGRVADEAVRGIRAGRYKSPQEAARAFSREVMALRPRAGARGSPHQAAH